MAPGRSQAAFLLGILALAAFLAALPGCAKPAKQTAFMKSTGKISTTAEELRTRMRDQAGIFAGAIEEAADIIMEETEDPDTYEAALRWKSRAIPAAYQAAFRPDPLVALLDTWAFAIQMRQLMVRNAEADLFSEYLPIALKTARELEAGIEAVALLAAVGDDVSVARQRLEEWAEENPIRSLTFSRTAITQHLQDRAVTQRKGGLAGVGTLTADMADLVARLGLYMEHMPKQAAWEAELIMTEHLPQEELDDFLLEVPHALQGLDEAAGILDDLPELIASERAIVLDAVSEERLAVMNEVHQELDRAYEFIERQRMAAFADLQVEREAIQEEVQRQRIATLEAIREERELAFQEADVMAMRIVDRAADRMEASLARMLFKAGLFLGAALILITLAGLILLRARRPAGAVG